MNTSDVNRHEISILIGPCSNEEAEEYLCLICETVEHRFGAAFAVRLWHEDEEPEVDVV